MSGWEGARGRMDVWGVGVGTCVDRWVCMGVRLGLWVVCVWL